MENRKDKLLGAIIDEYVGSAEPVGSSLLVAKYHLNVSSATVRNEMMELEKEGYIYQPHTSAGRVPTEKGYKFYVNNFIKENNKAAGIKDKFKKLENKENIDDEVKIKNIAKILAHESNEVMIIAFEAMNIYYTGLSNLFSQPEFYEHRLVCGLSEVIDRMDEVIYKCYNSHDDLKDSANILVGEENPFDSSCSSIIAKIRNKNKNILMCMLGPMRMDYKKNAALVEYAREYLTD